MKSSQKKHDGHLPRRSTKHQASTVFRSASLVPSSSKSWTAVAPQKHSVRAEPSMHASSRTPTKRQAEPKSTPTPKVAEQKHSVKKRAEGRAKVPEKLRDSFKDFSFSASGILKIIRMCLITAAAVCFIIGHAQAMFIAITIQEICIGLFFIISYMVTLQHLLTCLHWPLLDLINSVISAIFLAVVGIMTIQEKGRRHLFYVGGILCLTAAGLCFIDGAVVFKKMKEGNKKKARGTEKGNEKEASGNES